MARKKGTVNFDTMVRFFIQRYDIPTREDIEKLQTRFDRLEKLLMKWGKGPAEKRVGKSPGRGRSGSTASDAVLDLISKSKNGIRFPDIQAKTGFEEKKLRNIVFRLHKLGKIKRKDRGIYLPGSKKAKTEPQKEQSVEEGVEETIEEAAEETGSEG